MKELRLWLVGKLLPGDFGRHVVAFARWHWDKPSRKR